MARGYIDAPEAPAGRSGGVPVKTIVFSFLIFFAVLTLWSGYYSTHAGTADLVLRFGQVVRVTDPGPHLKVPYFESIHTVDMRQRAYPVSLEAASKDPMELPVTVTLNWEVNRSHVVEMYNEFGELDQFEKRIMAPRVPDAVKGVISTFGVNQLLTERVKLRENSLTAIKSVVPEKIMTITGFAVTNIGFPKVYTDQIVAVQVAREAANQQQEVLRKQNFIAQERTQLAQADANAVKAKADGDAYSIQKNAEADAARIALTGKSINDNLDRQAKILAGSSLLVEYKRAETWNGKLPEHFWGGDASAATMFNMPGARTAAPKQ